MGMSVQRHSPIALCGRERTPVTHWIWGSAGLRAGLDTEARGKILCIFRVSNPVRRVCSQTLYWPITQLLHRAVSYGCGTVVEWWLAEENPRTRRRTCVSITSSITYLAGNQCALNPRLSYDKVSCLKCNVYDLYLGSCNLYPRSAAWAFRYCVHLLKEMHN
jgi:hypothetical protein